MAWIVEVILEDRWSVAAETEPDASTLRNRGFAYVAAHPELFRHKGFSRNWGVRLPRELFPIKAHLESGHRIPPDLINIDGYAFSRRLRNLVETLEPDVHQFVEVPLYLRDGSPAPQSYYSVIVLQVARKQVDDALTTAERFRERIQIPRFETQGRIVINRNETSTWHMWFSEDLPNHLTVSDKLQELLVSENIPGLQYLHLPETTEI